MDEQKIMEHKTLTLTYRMKDRGTDEETLTADWDEKFLEENGLSSKEKVSYGYMKENNVAIRLKFNTEKPDFYLVARAIDDALNHVLTFTRILSMEINPKDKSVTVYPTGVWKFDDLKSFDMVKAYLNPEKEDDKKRVFAFNMVEHAMDFWGRFGSKRFLLFAEIQDVSEFFGAIRYLLDNEEIDKAKDLFQRISLKPDPLHYQLFLFPACGLENMEKYIKTDINGYNLEGDFWKRDWLRDEHKRHTTGGGKFRLK